MVTHCITARCGNTDGGANPATVLSCDSRNRHTLLGATYGEHTRPDPGKVRVPGRGSHLHRPRPSEGWRIGRRIASVTIINDRRNSFAPAGPAILLTRHAVGGILVSHSVIISSKHRRRGPLVGHTPLRIHIVGRRTSGALASTTWQLESPPGLSHANSRS